MFTVGVPEIVSDVPTTLNAVPEPVVVIFPVPKAIVIVPEALNKPVESVNVDKVKVPAVNVNVLVVPNVKFAPKVTLNALLIEQANVVEPAVIMLAAPIVNKPVADQVVVLDKVILPETVSVPVEVKVQVAPVVVNEAQANAPVKVIVGEPELALTITLSIVVGAAAPEAPPEDNDQ